MIPSANLPVRGQALALFRRTLWRHWRVFLDAALATALINVLALVSSLFAMQVYDRVVPNQAYQTLWVLAGGVLLTVLFDVVLKLARGHLLDSHGKEIELSLSQAFFERAQAIRMDARPQTVGTFAAQIRDFDAVKTFLTSTTLYALADAPFALLFVAVIGLLGGLPMALVPLIALPSALLVGLAVQWRLGHLSAQYMRESTIRNGLLIESIDGAEVIKAAGGTGWFNRRWATLSVLIGGVGVRVRNLSNLAGTLAGAIQQVSYVFLIVTGVYEIGAGHMTQGALIACSILSGRVFGPITQLTSLMVSWHNARQALIALDDLMARPQDGEAGVQPVQVETLKGDLRLEAVQFSYGQQVTAIDVPALRIQPGERVAIIGPSGSGKSTLLKLMSGLYKPGQGRAFLDGIDQQHLAPPQLRAAIAYLTQDVRLFNGTLRDNLGLGLRAPSDADLLQVAQLTGLDRLIQAHPRGIGLEISEGGRGLSGGQRQLVGLARALLQNAPLLLLDEPTASLDPQSENGLIQRLGGFLRADQTLVLVTHKPALLALVQRVLVVDRGRVVLDGERDAVLRQLQNALMPAAAVSA